MTTKPKTYQWSIQLDPMDWSSETGCGYMEFDSPEAAEEAIQLLAMPALSQTAQ